MINDEKLNLIKKGGIIVNTSRGGIVDEVALFQRSSVMLFLPALMYLAKNHLI